MCTPGGGTDTPGPAVPATVAVRIVAGNVTTLLCGCCIISIKSVLYENSYFITFLINIKFVITLMLYCNYIWLA